MTDALVSVIMPVYNRENTIRQAIDSVLCQTHYCLELIIVDDGSTDNTLKIVQAYTDGRVRLIRQQHGGANKARNVGIAHAKGEYIAFQDSDDEWMADKLDVQLMRLQREGYQACYGAITFYDGHSVYTVPGDFEDQEKYEAGLGKVLAEYNVVGTPALMIKREVLELLGDEYFDERMPRLQDYEFAIRLLKVCRLAYINRPLVNAFRTEGSITTNSSALYVSIGRIIQKHREFLDLEQFMDAAIRAEVGIDKPLQLIEDLRTLQERTGLNDRECKDRMFMYLSQKLDIQNKILSEQYRLAVDNLQDKKFAIYGAGMIGHEAYYTLQKRGLHPACFLVTKYGKDKVIDNIPILSVDDYSNREDMVIISVAAERQVELMDNLIARNYRQFCVYCKIL